MGQAETRAGTRGLTQQDEEQKNRHTRKGHGGKEAVRGLNSRQTVQALAFHWENPGEGGNWSYIEYQRRGFS